MDENKTDKTICKSVFKGGENTTTKIQFTKKWIELINKLEKTKSAKFQRQVVTNQKKIRYNIFIELVCPISKEIE